MNFQPIERRLAELRKQGKLEEVLHQRVETLPWSEILYVFHYVAIAGLGVHIVRMAMTASQTKERPADAEFLWFVVLAFVAVALRIASLFARTKAERVMRKVRKHGRCVPAAIVQANPAFFAPGNDQWVPADLLVSFDENAMRSPERLSAVARRLESLRHLDRRTLPPEQAEIAWGLYHEMGPRPSDPVPAALSEGLRDCLLVSVMLPPRPLLEDDCLVGLAIANELSPFAVAVLPAEVMG